MGAKFLLVHTRAGHIHAQAAASQHLKSHPVRQTLSCTSGVMLLCLAVPTGCSAAVAVYGPDAACLVTS